MVNLPIAILWMVGIPLTVCGLLAVSGWWAVLMIPVWSLITGRITDRWIPAVTGPWIDKAYAAAGKSFR
jgi:hypothetical protein